jgi:hypothetical protein
MGGIGHVGADPVVENRFNLDVIKAISIILMVKKLRQKLIYLEAVVSLVFFEFLFEAIYSSFEAIHPSQN